MTSPVRHDVCIIGCGLVGLAVGRALMAARPGLTLLMLDKEPQVAAHQSSHNSGVVHSGLYYQPGSLKAELAVSGRRAMFDLCEAAGIRSRRSGKLVIATHHSQVAALDELERRGTANGLRGLRRLGSDGIKEIEPHAVGVDALHVPEAGVADFPAVAAHIAHELTTAGATIRTGHPVTEIRHDTDGATVTAGGERFSSRYLINCAGLHSDRVARMAGLDPAVRIVPFRGEYYRLADHAADLVSELIYPVPDPRFPFLGVHFTRRADGTVEVGPNAVLGLGREHYRGARINWGDVREVLGYSGFRRLAMRHWWSGAKEMVQSRSARLYARQASLLVPGITKHDLLPGGAGVRAQALRPDGTLVDDFVIERAGATVHILNAPSPAATASLAIGEHIAAKMFTT